MYLIQDHKYHSLELSYNTSIVHISERSVDFTDLDVSLNSHTCHENITFMCKSRVPATLGVNKGISNYKESSQNKRTVLSESELIRDPRGFSGTPFEVYEKVLKVSKFYIYLS